jgi:arsenate reductase-like glutaredoxin family protein
MEARGAQIREQVPASRKLGDKEARAIAKASSRVLVARGKSLRDFGGAGGEPKVDRELIPAMLGSTGNLRAPLIRVGKTAVVGFNPDVYGELFD